MTYGSTWLAMLEELYGKEYVEKLLEEEKKEAEKETEAGYSNGCDFRSRIPKISSLKKVSQSVSQASCQEL